MEKILNQLKEHQANVETSYPAYIELTTDIFSDITEMLMTEFSTLSSDTKKLRIVKDCLRNILEKAFIGNGHKNYMRDVFHIFLSRDMEVFMADVLGKEMDDFRYLTARIKYELIYWQGYEGVMHRKLEKILSHLN